jgi:allophanate hydrolase
MKKVAIPEKISIEVLQEMYASGALTPEEVVLEIIERSERDVEMNIWITKPDMKFIGPYLEGLQKLDPNEAPLWGMPFAIKDNIDLGGVTTTAGCLEYSFIPEEHAYVVEKLVQAGAIPVGKANLDQFATGLVGTRSPYGETHNALDPSLISGGSSSGSAVSVARGQTAFALGTDTAGSGRVPAALNRLVGFKPSLGAWSTEGVVPACASLDCVTVFANSIDDCKLVDSVVRGVNTQDPWSRNLEKPSYELPKKILLPKGPLYFFGPYDKEYEAAWHHTVETLEKGQIPVEYVDIELFSEAAAILYGGPWIAERWAALGEFIEANPDTAFEVTEKILRSGSGDHYDAASVFEAMYKLKELKSKASKLLKDAVFIMPTAGGTWTRDEVRENPIATNSDMGRYTNHCNLLDLCAIAVPTKDATDNIPFGITMFAEADQEGYIFGLAKLFTGEELPTDKEKVRTTLVAVCGLHMRSFPLEKQMIECGATFIREDLTADKYKFIKLPTTPAKPGLLKRDQGGSSIEVEIWKMPLKEFGKFATAIPSPLGIGKVELQDGTEVPGFICEAYAEAGALDITSLKSWRKVSL